MAQLVQWGGTLPRLGPEFAHTHDGQGKLVWWCIPQAAEGVFTRSALRTRSFHIPHAYAADVQRSLPSPNPFSHAVSFEADDLGKDCVRAWAVMVTALGPLYLKRKSLGQAMLNVRSPCS